MFIVRGKLKPEKVFDLLRKIDPPVGWGKLCPRITAYKVRKVTFDPLSVREI